MPSAPYPIVQDVLNVARVRLNDAILTPAGAPSGQIGGEVVGDNQIFTQAGVNAAWQRFQEALVAQQFSRLVNTVILSNVTAVATTDPGIFVYIDWSNYYNGATLQTSPLLPQDLTTPLRLRERVHGATGTAAEFTPMEYVTNGLNGLPKGPRNYNWTWDSDKIKMPGSTQAMDLELRYVSFLPAFVDSGSPITAWYDQSVPIMRCEDALAWYICSEFANSRGDLDGEAIDAKAEAAMQKLVARELQNDLLRGEWVIPDIPPATGATPYDVVSTMLNTVKVRLNQLNKVAADVLVANQAFTQQCVNTGWRKLQEFLAAKGFKRLETEVILSSIPVVATADQGIMCRLDWSGFNDGVATTSSPALPQNLIAPSRMWERPHGTGAFTEMENIRDGISDQAKTTRNYNWEWRNDAVYIPGSTAVVDLRIRFFQYLGDFEEAGSPPSPWYLQQIPISRALDSLAWYACLEVIAARPDLQFDPAKVADIRMQAETAATLLAGRDDQQAAQRQQWIVPSIPAQTGATPYDTVGTILNTVRTRLNVAGKSAGDVVTANQSYMQQMFNTAYRRFQARLADLGYAGLMERVILTNLAAKVSQDPSVQVSLDWNGYNNGTTLDPTIFLPQDLILPMYMWERQTGMNASFCDMVRWLDGMPSSAPVSAFNHIWDWRGNIIYMPGANYNTDLQILYAKFLPDIIATTGVPWYNQPVPIVRALDSLANYVCVEVAQSRPDLELDPSAFQQAAELACDLINNRDIRQKQRVNVRRLSRSGRLDGNGYGWDYGRN